MLDLHLTATKLPTQSLTKLYSIYHQTLTNDLIHLLNGKLVFYERTFTSSKCLYRIVMHTSLSHDTFSTFHVSPTVNHIGEYNVLYRIKLLYFLPRLRRDFNDCIKVYSYCNVMYKRRYRGGKLLFSLSISAQFDIVYMDI